MYRLKRVNLYFSEEQLKVSHLVAQTAPKLSIYPMVASDLWYSYFLRLQNVGL